MFTHVQLLIVLSIVRENSYHAYGVGSSEFTRLAQDVGARCVSVWMILQTVQKRKEKAQRKGGQNRIRAEWLHCPKLANTSRYDNISAFLLFE